MKTEKLDKYWDEFITTFIKALLEDGYDEFEVLDKIMDSFRMIRKSRINSEISLSQEKVFTAAEKNVVEHRRKYPENKKNPDRSKNPHNYDKTLSSKFEHACVYIKDKKDESLATIERGPSQRVKDTYKIVSTGETLNEVQYLKKFNSENNETPRGFGFLNRHVIVFDINPEVSVGYVKMPSNYKKFQSIRDIKNFTKYNKRK